MQGMPEKTATDDSKAAAKPDITASPQRREHLVVGWKVSTLDRFVASLRYRALLPALALKQRGIKSRIFSSPSVDHLKGLDVLVVVKSFASADLNLVEEAHDRGIPVILDLCDNIFIPDYVGKGGRTPADVFFEMALHATAITTTTEPLAEAISNATANRVPVFIALDGFDDVSDTQQQLLMWAALLRNLRVTLVKNIQALPHRQLGTGIFATLGRGLKQAGFRGIRLYRQIAAHIPAKRRHWTGTVAVSPDSSIHFGNGSAPKRILWFGNHGGPYANFGISDLLLMRDALEQIARNLPVELIVVSNNRKKYLDNIAPLAIPSRYVEWSPASQKKALAVSDVVLVPNSLDAFSICKSANRTILSLMNGVPVVATQTPALAPLTSVIETGDAYLGMTRYLTEPQLVREHIEEAGKIIKSTYGQRPLADRWMEIIGKARKNPEDIESSRAFSPRVIVCLHMVQDLDLAIPIILELAKREFPYQVWVSVSLMRKSPRVATTLGNMRARWRAIPDEDAKSPYLRFPNSVRAVLAVAETNLGPHRFSHLVIRRANQLGITTFCMQHGFENVGLTYSDSVHAIGKVKIAAKHIFTWGSLMSLHPDCQQSVRSRCIPVGCPKPSRIDVHPDIRNLLRGEMPIIGVFENLHWHRYDESYRQHVLETVIALAHKFKDHLIVIKPHHAGMWYAKQKERAGPAEINIVVADPKDPQWEPYTAGQLLGAMAAVITTPSTVALDAARMGIPVAVLAFDLNLPNYEPLPLLTSEQSCVAFIRSSIGGAGRAQLVEKAEMFVRGAILPSNAVINIVEQLERSTA